MMCFRFVTHKTPPNVTSELLRTFFSIVARVVQVTMEQWSIDIGSGRNLVKVLHTFSDNKTKWNESFDDCNDCTGNNTQRKTKIYDFVSGKFSCGRAHSHSQHKNDWTTSSVIHFVSDKIVICPTTQSSKTATMCCAPHIFFVFVFEIRFRFFF